MKIIVSDKNKIKIVIQATDAYIVHKNKNIQHILICCVNRFISWKCNNGDKLRNISAWQTFKVYYYNLFSDPPPPHTDAISRSSQ